MCTEWIFGYSVEIESLWCNSLYVLPCKSIPVSAGCVYLEHVISHTGRNGVVCPEWHGVQGVHTFLCYTGICMYCNVHVCVG